jgi:hypothetical protein
MAVAAHPKLSLAGRKYVLLPLDEYKRHCRFTAQERGDMRMARSALAKWHAGKLRTVSHAEVKRKFGL